jgi:hypothetical protein
VLLGGAAGAAAAAVITAGVVRVRRQLDGDGYGLAIEVAFALILVGCAVAS